MTGTERSLFSALEGKAQFLTVDHGQVWYCRADKRGNASYVWRMDAPTHRRCRTKNWSATRGTSCCRRSAGRGSKS